MKRLYAGVLLLVLCCQVLAADADLVFTPEAGVRVEGASIPEASLDASGVTWLYYNTPGQDRVSTSTDGVTFPAGSTYTTYANDPRNVRLPDGTYRRFAQFSLPANYDVSSQSSTDGITFSHDAGIRYATAPADNGTIGIVEVFSQASGDVVMLYLGDLMGKNNTRRARSTDGGNTFTYETGNILGDDNAGGGANAFVDITTIVLPDGRRRLFAMKGGHGIYSFISSDDGQTFTQEDGARLSNTDFTEFNVIGMFDPSVVPLSDGHYRMYIGADVDLGNGTIAHRILSAVTQSSSAQPASLQVTGLKLISDFHQSNHDSFRLTATVSLPEALELNGQSVTLDIGGATAAFTLDARGRGTVSGGVISLRKATATKLTARVAQGSFNAFWLDEGLVNADSSATVSMPVTLTIGGQSYSGTKSLKYSARANRAGHAK